MTHTYAILDVPAEVYDLIRERLEAVAYTHTFHDQPESEGGEVIDMHGIALGREPDLAPVEIKPMRTRIVRAGAGPDGVELDLHEGAGTLACEDGGTYLRLELGNRDAGSLLQFIRRAYPDGVDTVPVGHDCAQLGCLNEPALIEGELVWCEEHAPDSASAQGLERPQRRLATVEGVRFYLRSAYGMNGREANEAIAAHPYSIAMAISRGMSIEAVAVDIARRTREGSGRLRLEAQADALEQDYERASKESQERVAALRAARGAKR